MLVSVTERTREIGIRLAIGALEREVLLQFLVEAVVLSSLGGIVGIALALGASLLLSGVMQVPFVFNGTIVLVAFLFSAAVGVVFGYFPARQAARQQTGVGRRSGRLDAQLPCPASNAGKTWLAAVVPTNRSLLANRKRAPGG